MVRKRASELPKGHLVPFTQPYQAKVLSNERIFDTIFLHYSHLSLLLVKRLMIRPGENELPLSCLPPPP